MFVFCVEGPKTITPAVFFPVHFWAYIFPCGEYRNQWFGCIVCDLSGRAQNDHSGGIISETSLDRFPLRMSTEIDGLGHVL